MPWIEKIYRRDELYEKVWTKPVREVAEEYGVSDVTIANICRKLDVPRPGRGWWLRKNAGASVSRMPLPALKAGAPKEHVVRFYEHELADWEKMPPLPDVPVSDVAVAPTLEDPHPLVARTLKAVRKEKPDREGYVWARGSDTLNLHIGLKSLDRALRIYDALIEALVAGGHRFACIDGKGGCAIVDGEELPVRLEEVQKQVPHVPDPKEFFPPTYDRSPSGTLRVRVTWNPGYGSDKEWRETENKPMEKRLGQIVAGIITCAADRKRHLVVRAERERRAKEAEIQRYEREQAARKEQEELDRRVKLARRWRDAAEVRQFLSAVRDEARIRLGAFEPTSQAGKWFEQMERLAERLDPIPGLFEAK